MFEKEIWKPISGYEGLYEVSSYGRVRSVSRIVKCRGIGMRKLKGKMRPAQKRGNGYLFVSLCKNRKHKMHSIHRLVAEAFIPNPDNLPYVNHKDETKTNNNVDNLEWCTASYNATYGTSKLRASDKRAKPVAIIMYGREIARFRCARDAEHLTGINHCNISQCANGKIKTAGGYQWKFV